MGCRVGECPQILVRGVLQKEGEEAPKWALWRWKCLARGEQRFADGLSQNRFSPDDEVTESKRTPPQTPFSILPFFTQPLFEHLEIRVHVAPAEEGNHEQYGAN